MLRSLSDLADARLELVLVTDRAQLIPEPPFCHSFVDLKVCFRSLWCWNVEILELFNRSLQVCFIVTTMFWFFWFQLKKIQIFWISAGSCSQLLSAVSPLLMDYFPAVNEMSLIMDLTWKQFLAAALCWGQTQKRTFISGMIGLDVSWCSMSPLISPIIFRAHWFLVVVCFPSLEDVQYEKFHSSTGETCSSLIEIRRMSSRLCDCKSFFVPWSTWCIVEPLISVSYLKDMFLSGWWCFDLVSGQFERAAGKPSVSLRSQQKPVNIPAPITPHWLVNGEFCACFQWDPVFVPLGMPSAGLSQRHGAQEVSCKQTWSSQVLGLSFNKMLVYLQAVHTGHGLSETVLPRERLQTSQRVSPALTHLLFR